jgi:hypothetical protein
MVLPVVNFFYQSELVSFFTKIGWEKIVSLVSGHWWNSLATFVLILGILLTSWQIFEARKSTNAQIAMDLFRELRSDRALRILRYIYSLQPQEVNRPEAIDDQLILYVLDRFEVLGVLVDQGTVDERIAINAYGGASALRCWYQLNKYIKETTEKRGPYKLNFEVFARRSLAYFRKERLDVKFRSESMQEEPVNLTCKLWEPGLRPRTWKEIRKGTRAAVKPAGKLAARTTSNGKS